MAQGVGVVPRAVLGGPRNPLHATGGREKRRHPPCSGQSPSVARSTGGCVVLACLPCLQCATATSSADGRAASHGFVWRGCVGPYQIGAPRSWFVRLFPLCWPASYVTAPPFYFCPTGSSFHPRRLAQNGRQSAVAVSKRDGGATVGLPLAPRTMRGSSLISPERLEPLGADPYTSSIPSPPQCSRHGRAPGISLAFLHANAPFHADDSDLFFS